MSHSRASRVSRSSRLFPSAAGTARGSTLNEPSPWLAAIAAFFRRVWEKTEFLVIHTIGVAVALGLMWIVHLALKWSLGLDYKLLDVLPVLYVIDLCDLLVLLQFMWQLLKRFRKH